MARSGELRGLAVHVEITVDPASREAEISSEMDGSHWPRVLLLLPRGVPIAEGEVLTVVVACIGLDTPQPRYAFEVAVEGRDERWTLSYP